jgi:hypothetical protein
MRRIRKRMIRHRYLFTLDDQSAFSGVLMDADDEFYVLRQVRSYTSDGEPIPVDGELVIERHRVLYAQLEG